MKNVFKLFGIIALLAIIGFSMAACGGDDGGGDDGTITIDGWKWWTYTDNAAGGISTITITQGSGNDSKKLIISGNVQKIPGQMWGVASFGTTPDGANLTAFKNADSFSFTCKGDGKKYYVTVDTSDVKDDNFHRKTFTASTTESTITVQYSDLVQQTSWGTIIPFNKNNIIRIKIEAWPGDDVTGEGPFNITIWDLKVGGSTSR